MLGMVLLAGMGYLAYIEIVTFFENRRAIKRNREYWDNYYENESKKNNPTFLSNY